MLRRGDGGLGVTTEGIGLAVKVAQGNVAKHVAKGAGDRAHK